MSNAVRVKVELKHYSKHYQEEDRMVVFQRMLKAFRKQCGEFGLMPAIKQYSSFESRSRKRRRKRRESEIALFKMKLKENFPQTPGKNSRKKDSDERKENK